MEDVKIYKKINSIAPVMIAGWPGMGSVALGVADYLKRSLEATRFAEITVDKFAFLDAMLVENGLAKFPDPPKNTFYYAKDHDIIIFEGEAQLAGAAGISLLNRVLDVASEFKTSRIYTGAAFAMPISHKAASDVYAVANKGEMKPGLKKLGARLMEGGHISGLNGLMLGFAEKRNIEAACFLATIPQYAIGIPNPKASLAIIDVLSRMLGFQVDFHEINEFIKDMDEKMSQIEDKVKDAFSIGEDKPNIPAPPSEKKVPGYVMERIEKLFQEAKADKKKAMELKRELDRWDLYKVYEDRFLDLFRESQ